MSQNNFTYSVTKFLKHLAQERGLSPHTVAAYKSNLTSISTLLRQHGYSAWSQVTQEGVRLLLQQEKKRGLSEKSLAQKLSALKTFMAYQLQNNERSSDPTHGLSVPSRKRRLPNLLSIEEIEQLLAFAETDGLSIRDRALIELIYSSGLRLGEVAGLQCEDLDLATRRVRVMGKGQRARLVPVGRQAHQALLKWHHIRPQWAQGNTTALFVSRQGRPLSRRQIENRLRYWSQEQHLANPVHPHQLRHAFATHVLESSGNLRAVQTLLGHRSLSSTQIYTHLDFQYLAKNYDWAHPRAKRQAEGARQEPHNTEDAS